MSTENTVDTQPEVIHNNIKCTNARLHTLIDEIKDCDDLSLVEKDRMTELLNHCIVSTNGRSTPQKVQDLTEIMSNVAAYSVETSIDFRHLDKELKQMKNDLESSMEEKLEKFMGKFIDRVEKKIDNLDDSITLTSKNVAVLESNVQQMKESITNYEKEYIPKIVNISHEVNDLKEEISKHHPFQATFTTTNTDKPKEQDEVKPNSWLSAFTKISLSQPKLVAFIIGSILLSLSLSPQVHEMVSKIINHFFK